MDGRILDIRPDHITNGNQAATLALLWAIAIKFEVRMGFIQECLPVKTGNVIMASQSDSDPVS